MVATHPKGDGLPPAVSVVIRTLGRGGHLPDALESLARQTWRDFEVVVVDMSDGRIARELQAFAARVPALRQLIHRRLPRPAALNAGIAAAHGTIIAVLDDDNTDHPGHLALLAGRLGDPAVDYAYTGVRHATYSPDGALILALELSTPFDHKRLLFTNFIYATGSAYRKALWTRLGGYDERFVVYEDWDFLIRAAQIGRLMHIPIVSGESRKFTGLAGVDTFHLEFDSFRRCHAGIHWKHRHLFDASAREELKEILRGALPPATPAARGPAHEDGRRLAAGTGMGPGRVVVGKPHVRNGPGPRMRSVFPAAGVRRLVVTAHPNHELAIFGFIQRTRPRLLFLTDGGGPHRVADSQRGLAALGLLAEARFVPTPESALYHALLDRQHGMFAALVAEVRAELEATGAQEVICEGVEFYNPLHDITLPIVWAATRDRPDVHVWEFPLIAQVPQAAERYRVQRMAPDREALATALALTADELRTKLQARAQTYRCLEAQLGPVLADFTDDHFSVEYFVRADAPWRDPGPDDCVRYEWRARRLQADGQIARVITYHDHVRPMVTGLQDPE